MCAGHEKFPMIISEIECAKIFQSHTHTCFVGTVMGTIFINDFTQIELIIFTTAMAEIQTCDLFCGTNEKLIIRQRWVKECVRER
jgi:hypothetical protein